MASYIVSFYRKNVSPSFRGKIYNLFLKKALLFFRTLKPNIISKLVYLFRYILPASEKNKAWAFMGKYGLTSYPFNTAKVYKKQNIMVVRDFVNKMPYVIHNSNKLFFPAHFSEDAVSELYISLLTEQDEKSPHRYVLSYQELEGKTLLDIGSAEGIFALDTIEYTKHVYLFECEDYWVDALSATFAPWIGKVTIIQKYVCDIVNEKCTTIDTFAKEQMLDNLFIKMDIEGAERRALEGGIQILTEKNVDLSVCTYHGKNDSDIFELLLAKLGYNSFSSTEGFLFWQNRLSRAIIRAQKK